MVKMGSPSKDKDALKQSKKVLARANQNPVLHNHVRGFDEKYDSMWEDAMHNKSSLHYKTQNSF